MHRNFELASLDRSARAARSARAGTTLAAIIAGALLATGAVGCASSCHAVAPVSLGTPSSQPRMEALMDLPGPIEVETVVGADWAITRAGLIDLDAPAAKAAGLQDGDEPIQILLHVVRHPTRGVYLVDTGAVTNLDRDPAGAGVSWLLRQFMNLDKLHVRNGTAAVVARQKAPIAGVFMTHLHLDHVSGLGEVPAGTPVYIGPGEAEGRKLMHLFSQGTVDRMIGERGPLQELPFGPAGGPAPAGASSAPGGGRLAADDLATLDLFGDGSLFAVLVPGHTSGSLAFVARTARGPVLLTGDASHTRWGWDHDVGPGTFSEDRAGSAASFAALRRMAKRHPTLDVRVGHQR